MFVVSPTKSLDSNYSETSPTSPMNENHKKQLVARWVVVDNKLICQWTT